MAHAERQALAMRLDDKAARGEALAGQRQLLLNEMAALRQAMQRQEEVLRASLLRMRQKGSVALPEEVVRSLEAFQVTQGAGVSGTWTGEVSLVPNQPAGGWEGVKGRKMIGQSRDLMITPFLVRISLPLHAIISPLL